MQDCRSSSKSYKVFDKLDIWTKGIVIPGHNPLPIALSQELQSPAILTYKSVLGHQWQKPGLCGLLTIQPDLPASPQIITLC